MGLGLGLGGRAAPSWGRGPRERQARAGLGSKAGARRPLLCISTPPGAPPAPAPAPCPGPGPAPGTGRHLQARLSPVRGGDLLAKTSHAVLCDSRWSSLPVSKGPSGGGGGRQKWDLVCTHFTPSCQDASFHTRWVTEAGFGGAHGTHFFFKSPLCLITVSWSTWPLRFLDYKVPTKSKDGMNPKGQTPDPRQALSQESRDCSGRGPQPARGRAAPPRRTRET